MCDPFEISLSPHTQFVEDHVMAWVFSSFWRWEAEKPEWYTESWIAKVPPDMIPSEAKQAAKDMRASARRRSRFAMVAKEEGTRTVHPIS